MAKRRGHNEGTIVKRRDGRWMASMTLGRDSATGKTRRISFYGKTRQEVATKLTHALRDHHYGVFVAPEKITLGEWLRIWLEEYKRPGVRPKTMESYEQQIRLHILPALGHITLTALRPHHLQHFYNQLAQHVSARTVRHNHAVLHNALALAEKHRRLIANVSTLCTLPHVKQTEWPTLTVTDVTERLMPCLEEHRLGAAILLACGTGLRRGEILGLRWMDVDLRKEVLTVRQAAVRLAIPSSAGRKTQIVLQDVKTDKSRRTIPVPGLCLKALRRQKARQAQERLQWGAAYADRDLVFCQVDGRPLEGKTLNRALTQLLRQAGLPHVRVHDLRHTFATWMLEQGEHPKVVSTLLGHARIGITLDLYTHVSLEVEQRAMQRLNQALEGPSTS